MNWHRDRMARRARSVEMAKGCRGCSWIIILVILRYCCLFGLKVWCLCEIRMFRSRFPPAQKSQGGTTVVNWGGVFTFGDGRHCESHGNLEVVDGATDPGSSVDGVIEMADVDDPHGHTDEGDNLDGHTGVFF